MEIAMTMDVNTSMTITFVALIAAMSFMFWVNNRR